MQENILVQMEKAILASIFFSNTNYETIALKLRAQDFYLPSHKIIFEIMGECERANLPIDPNIVLQKSAGKVSESEIMEIKTTDSFANIETYAQSIKDAASKRELMEIANIMRQKSLDPNSEAQVILEEIERRISELFLGSFRSSDFHNSRDIVLDTIKHLEALKARGNSFLTGITTGFSDLNLVTTGFNEGDLIIVGARPSMGKTAFALNVAQSILNSGVGVAIFSLEMPAQQLMIRMMSSLSGLAMQNVRSANLTDPEWTHLTEIADNMARMELFIDDGSVLTISALRSKLRKLKRNNPNVGIAIVDYLQLMAGEKSSANGKQAEVSEISRGLKTLARELKMPIIALSQLNRAVEARDDKRPMMADLRESGAIEQDADIIMFLYRDGVYRKREDLQRKAKLEKEGRGAEYKPEYVEQETESAEVIVAKNRNGETRTVHLQYRKKNLRFESVQRHDTTEYADTKLDNSDLANLRDAIEF